MKKFLFFLFFLIVIGGVGFFAGWAQFKVPPGYYGVMRSKTHGVESRVIREGEFRWIWYKLIPTNTKLSVFSILPVRRSIKSSGTLVSGQVYSDFAGVDADFSWEVSGEIAFSLKPEYLPEIIVRQNIEDDEGLRAVEEDIAVKIESSVLQRLKNYADTDENRIGTIMMTGSLPEMNDEIEGLFPEITNFECTIQIVRYPDYDLYLAVKALYRDYLSRQNAALSPDVLREAERRIATRLRLDELTQYGELLTRYPILLQYLGLEGDLNPDAEYTAGEM